MELYRDILSKEIGALVLREMTHWRIEPEKLVELTALETLRSIRAVLADTALSDFECVDEIVRLLERIGSDGGQRHDFG